jgi:hypothetical protein
MFCVSGAAMAQMNKIALSTTADGRTCNINDTYGTVDIHVVALDVENFDAIQFAAPIPECWTGATYLGETHDGLLQLGNTQDPVHGLAIVWGGECLTGNVHVAKITIQTTGAAPPCCPYPIVKATGDLHPEVPGPIIVVCDPSEPDGLRLTGVSVDAVINPDPTCGCMSPLPVEETTWGGIKALYTN